MYTAAQPLPLVILLVSVPFGCGPAIGPGPGTSGVQGRSDIVVLESDPAPVQPEPVIVLRPDVLGDRPLPEGHSGAEQMAYLRQAFPGFEVGERTRRVGTNFYTPTGEGQPVYGHTFTVMADGEVLLATAQIHPGGSVWVEHASVADSRGLRIGATWAQFNERHQVAHCSPTGLDGFGAAVGEGRGYMCASRDPYAKYLFELPEGADPDPSEAELEGARLVWFAVHWRDLSASVEGSGVALTGR